MQDLTGRDIGRYHIVERLGEGGMATVYKAFDNRLERYVAIKVIRTDMFAPSVLEEVLKRFEREAKALARLAHPHIVKVHDYGDFEGMPYLIMEYLPGGTLKGYTGKPMPFAEASRLLAPVARALEFAHKQNILHRDIKPANILIDQSEQPMLTDFGIAKILDAGQTTNLTASSVGIGTPEYMAPEQGMGGAVDARADIYALGVVFYELITGRRPFSADTPMAVLVKHINEPLPRARQFVSGLPEDVEAVIFKALAKQPDERYPDMGAFASALEHLGNIASPTARLTTAPAASIPTFAPEKRTTPPPTNTRTAVQSTGATASVPRKQEKRQNYGLWIGLGVLGLIGCLAVGGFLLSRFWPLIAAQLQAATATSETIAVIPTQIPLPEPTRTMQIILQPGATNTIPVNPIQTETPLPEPQFFNFSTCLSEPCSNINGQYTFPEASKIVYLHWEYKNIPEGSEYIRTWSKDGIEWIRYECTWPGPQAGVADISLREPGGLASGTWVVSIKLDGIEVFKQQFQVEGNWNYWSPAGLINACYDK
jgi:tRNA A-37 threonylcarbamoyl transferase component Bud32